MAEIKRPTAVEQFINARVPRHEPEVEESKLREAFEEVRAPKTRGREGIMLDIRLKDGRCSGFSYAYLVRTDYLPGDTICLHFPQSEILVEGRSLSALYRRLLDHRVEAIQEGTEYEDGLKPEEAAHIDSIIINTRTEENA